MSVTGGNNERFQTKFYEKHGFGFGWSPSCLHTDAGGVNAVPAVSGDSEKLLIKDPYHPKPAPMGYDRLPLSWYKETAKRMKEKVAAQGVDVVVLA